MDDFKKLALEISNRHPFSDFDMAAHGMKTVDDKESPSSCGNHLDKEFMKWLDEGKHLDLSIMSL